MVGITNRDFDYHPDQTLPIHIENPNHPITFGLQDWIIQDETYSMSDPCANCNILLTTSHTPSMKAIAWEHQFQKARVFCYQAGHDNKAWSDPNFQKVLSQGIIWVSRNGDR